jgi:hypothetical protein
MCMYVKYVHDVINTLNLHRIVTGDMVWVWIVLAVENLERCIRDLRFLVLGGGNDVAA